MSSLFRQSVAEAREEAALWYARMSSNVRSQEDRQAFDAWIAASEDHAEAYAEACALADRLGTLAEHPQIVALRTEARRFEEHNRRALMSRISGAWAAMGIAAAAAIVAVFHFSVAAPQNGVWATARGETREIALSDGSEVVLGSDSRLEMHFRRERREMDLDHGQAFFDVAHDADRPFTVAANGRMVTALGTAFDVRSYANETTVTLVRGRVAITGREGDNKVVLKPGQQFDLESGAASVRNVDARAATSWKKGTLEFDAAKLGDVAAEINRNAVHSILISDPRVANLLVSGVFRANDPKGFAAALMPAYPLMVAIQPTGDVVISYRAAKAEARDR